MLQKLHEYDVLTAKLDYILKELNKCCKSCKKSLMSSDEFLNRLVECIRDWEPLPYNDNTTFDFYKQQVDFLFKEVKKYHDFLYECQGKRQDMLNIALGTKAITLQQLNEIMKKKLAIINKLQDKDI